MAGQMIVLPGVTAAAGAGAPRVNMNTPDTIAAKIASLKHVVSARSLTADAVNGVAGRCRATGLPLTSKGSGRSSLAVVGIGGNVGLGLPPGNSGNAALALPAGSLTSSFTFVTALYLAASDASGTSAGNFLSGYDGVENYISALLRSYGSASTASAGLLTATTNTSSPVAINNPAGNTWAIVVVDYNNETRRISISLNQADTFASGVKSADFAPGNGAYMEIGYHLGVQTLRDSKVGDLYTFNDSLLRSDLGKTQLKDLVAALKTYYGIA